MTDHKDIHEAINAVMQEVGYVRKQRAANLNYSFAGEAALIEALRPAMVEHGVYPSIQKIHAITREPYTTKNGTQMINTVIHGAVRFNHVSGTFLDVEACGEGSDAGDKSANKAMTGLYKYALRQTFCIETGDDPDKSPSVERAAKEKREEVKQRAAVEQGIPTDTSNTYPDTGVMVDPMENDQVAWAALQWNTSKGDAAKQIASKNLGKSVDSGAFKRLVMGG